LELPAGGKVSVKPLQPVVWVSVAPPEVVELPIEAPRFPALIDTGFNQALLIQDSHLWLWGGVKPADLQVHPGENARYGDQVWPFRIADIWLHPSGSNDANPVPVAAPYCLETHPGILVVPANERRQRLPILGMRALAWNRIRLQLDFDGPDMGWLSMDTP
jgi:hypothetical protein